MTTTLVPTINRATSATGGRSRTERTVRPVRPLPPVPSAGLASGAIAATANVAVAAVARASGVTLQMTGTGAGAGSHSARSIPVGGFASLTLLGALAGIQLAAGARRWSHRPATRFVQLAVLGTVLSLIPDAISAADTPTMLVLWLTHVVAAGIIVTLLAARLWAGAENAQ